ncbi:zinc finger protein [Macleaya cordata]|uniref:Zinc finger protein n=1 Tax=Macleaya cordata TaxID=56857 RepID=A0A200RC60_MACCD|nr:zinc finger protein [Macleaya cordata]
MEPGQGTALFTAECSHSFHFNCITSYVKHGNQICPICRAQWKDMPFHNPTTSDLSHGTEINIINPVDWPQVNAIPTILPRVPFRTNSFRHIIQTSEPSVFNDDDFVDPQPDFPSNNSIFKSIDIKTYPEVSAVQQSTSQENFNILINLKAHVTSENHASNAHISRAPIDLVTVLDVSGSMTGTKIELLKRAMGFVIENLGSSDRLSVISFSSTAQRLFPLRRMTDSGRELALQAVNRLRAGGETNILEGLRKGAKVIEDRRQKNLVCSIMLLSDGQDSYRNSTHLQQDLSLQIPVHTFGFGTDHDPVLLHSISESCMGTFSFIEAEGVIQDAFAQCIGGLLSVVVQDLQVHVQAVHPDLRLGQIKAGSYDTRLINDNRAGFINVGDLYADEERDFLVLVNVPAVGKDSSNETNLVNVWCVYKDPFSKETMTTEVKEVKIHRPAIVEEEWVVVSIEVDRQRNRLQAAEAMEEARAAAERSDLSSAWSILENCRRVISETTSSRAGDQFSVALDAELEEVRVRMANMRTYKSSGRAYALSGISSHSRQRATTRGDSTEGTSLVHAYQTPSMFKMVNRSQMSTHPIVRPPNSFTESNQSS